MPIERLVMEKTTRDQLRSTSIGRAALEDLLTTASKMHGAAVTASRPR